MIEYAQATAEGAAQMIGDIGMETGLAKKSGNADGVKVSTTIKSG